MFLLSALLGCVATAADPPSECPGTFQTRAPQPGWNTGYTVAGQSRSFYLMTPKAPVKDAPVFFAFNGTTEDGKEFAERAELEDFVAKGFIVVAPSSAGNGQFWPVWDGLRARGHEGDPNADVALFDSLLACLPEHMSIDQRRIYVGGHSAGGIFTNHLLQRRSNRIAGAIVASGVYSQTTPDPVVPLDPTTVIVTWGGENDRWSGRAGDTMVRGFGFAAEASAASRAYTKAGASVVSCKGYEIGHAWLDRLNPWMADILLAHPKGAPPLTTLPLLPKSGEASCVLGPVQDTPPDPLTCPESATPGCQYMCQQLADGAVRNRTVQPVLAGELAKLGFDDEGCGGCVAHCEAEATKPADAEALACIVTQPPIDPEERGIAAALPLIDAVDTCCTDRTDSGWCLDICGTMRKNIAARPYFKGCPR